MPPDDPSPPPKRVQLIGRAITGLVARAPFTWPLLRGWSHRFWERAAPTWDQRVNRSGPEYLAPLAAALLHVKPEPERALDIGCGTGLVTELLARCVGSAGSVVGIDLSASMLDIARACRGAPNTTYMTMAAEHVVFRDRSFDLVTYGESLPYLIDPLASLEEAVRLLRPSGRIGISVHRRALHTEAQDIFYRSLESLARRHHLNIPRHSPERGVLAEKETIYRLLDELGFTDLRTTELVTGGRARTPREWTEVLAGMGPLPGTLISVLGPRLREQFEAELSETMAPLGDDAFRYHLAFVFATGRLS
jgi:ubiquinone/menaquinone biosynthesis C-methylase UbiE